MINKEVCVFLFSLGVLLFNWPFLDIFSLSLPYYLFGVWGIFIIVIGISIKTGKSGNQSV